MAFDLVFDASALVAIIKEEPTAPMLAAAGMDAENPVMSSATLLETFLAASSSLRSDSRQEVNELILRFAIRIVPFDEDLARDAYIAFLRFGKGRHPAALNFGDCMVYALAARYNAPILCTGNDFAKTDIKVVELS